jgi:hypothetical protein
MRFMEGGYRNSGTLFERQLLHPADKRTAKNYWDSICVPLHDALLRLDGNYLCSRFVVSRNGIYWSSKVARISASQSPRLAHIHP